MLNKIIVLIFLIVGFVLGLAVGWSTVEFKPSADDVAAAADSYALNGDANLAKARLQSLSKAELARILNSLIRERNTSNRTIEAERLNALARALNVAVGSSPSVTPGSTETSSPAVLNAPSAPSTITNLLVSVGLILIFALVLIGGGIIFVSRITPEMNETREAAPPSIPLRTSSSGGGRFASSPEDDDARQLTKSSTPTRKEAGGVLGHFRTAYTLGSDRYDVSFPLESSQREFLGECGLGVSETIGEGAPEKVTALDLWLFDKADVRTVTQILMSEYAFNAPGLRAKVSKGEAVLAVENKTLTLETQSLHIQATIVELVYTANPNFPPNSHFQKLGVEIVASMKQGAAHSRLNLARYK